jgi:hypothetical protein
MTPFFAHFHRVEGRVLAAAREPAKNSGQEISQAMVWS